MKFRQSILAEKLKTLIKITRKEEKIAERYINEIKNKHVELPFWDKSENHVFHIFG